MRSFYKTINMVKALFIFTVLLSLLACSKSNISSPKNNYRKELIGHWNHFKTTYKGTYSDGTIDTISVMADSSYFEFNEDGKFSKFEKIDYGGGDVHYEDNTGTNSGTYTLDDSIIHVTATILWGGSLYIIKSLSNNTLVLYRISIGSNPLKNELWYFYTR